jgi:gluconokinase
MANLLIVMGVSGCGKSSVAKSLALTLDYLYLDADDFHSDAAKNHMASGRPLTAEMRAQWMQYLQSYLTKKSQQNVCVVLAHSGLKKTHRDQLRALPFSQQFFFLQGNESVITKRMKKRSEHFFPVTLLTSQFADLEHPSQWQQRGEELDIYYIDIEQTLPAVLKQVKQFAKEFIFINEQKE